MDKQTPHHDGRTCLFCGTHHMTPCRCGGHCGSCQYWHSCNHPLEHDRHPKASQYPRRNARFWVLGPDCEHVKLALRYGQSLTWASYSPDEEGYSVTSETWTHMGDHVRREYQTRGRDCDGPHTSGGTTICRLEHLHDWHNRPHTHPDGMPRWQEGETYQRDQYAEAMGY